MARLLAVALAALVFASGAPATRSGTEVERLPTHRNLVALTFDGAWDSAGVPRILAALRRYHAKATFFVTGSWVRKNRRLARLIGRRYQVGDHSWSHSQFTGLSDEAIRKEVRRSAWWIRVVTGRNPKPLFRFPYGARDARTIRDVNALGYTSVRWSIDTWGWMGPTEGQSTATVLHRVASLLQPGAIVLMHIGASKDGSTLDADALPAVLRLLRARGYRTVTLDRWVTAPR